MLFPLSQLDCNLSQEVQVSAGGGGGLRGLLISYDFFTKIQLKFLVSEVKLPCDYFSCLGFLLFFFVMRGVKKKVTSSH